MARTQFHRYAWGLLVYNLLTILGGAYVRATMSGDGCGNNWPNCNGEIIPHAPALKTAIEFTHRASTGLLGILALVLLVWAFLAFPKKHPVRLGAMLVVALVIVEALIGKALVDYKLVAHDESIYRAIAMPSHLVATFLLLA